MNDRYEAYILNNRYAKDTNFDMVMTSVNKLVSTVNFTNNTVLQPMKLLIVRHAEDNNEMMGGWSNNELTKRGSKQANLLASTLKENFKDINTFITSDLLRARQTAQIISDNLGVEFVVDKSFRETNNGDLANLTKAEVFKRYPELLFTNLDINQKYPNGESPKEFYSRIKDAFLSLNEQYKNKTILLLTHGGVFGVIKSIVNAVEWNNKQKYQIDYAEIKEIELHLESEKN